MTLRTDAFDYINRERLVERTSELVDIASPTGGEKPLATYIAQVMTEAGIDASIQDIGQGSANAWGAVGNSAGPSVLLYAPLDTVTSGNVEEDIPWAAATLRTDMRAEAFQEHGWIVGLGAHNPKGHAACVLVAIEALSHATKGLGPGSHSRLMGQVQAGFGSLGMPANRRRPELLDGHGAGCAALCELLQPSAAVIAKSGWAVSWSEVGLLWFTVRVFGSHTYVGSRHLLRYRSAIADAAHIITELESWFDTWAQEAGDEFNSPQGIVASVSGGEERATAFTPNLCSFSVDLRIVPGMNPDDAEEAFVKRVTEAAEARNAVFEVNRTVTIPGTFTDPDEPIVQAAVVAWENRTGRSHEPIRGLSGATDANILRGKGIATARVGLPKVSAPGIDVDFQYGMNAVNPDDQVELTMQLVDTALIYLENPA